MGGFSVGVVEPVRSTRTFSSARSMAAWTAASLLAFAVTPASAALVIDEPTDSFTAAAGDEMGDFFAVAGTTDASAPGQVVEVLGGTLGGDADLQDSPSESGTNSLDIGDLWAALNDGGVTSTSSLVFGFGINESGGGNSAVTITNLVMSFELPGGGSQTFALQGDTIEVDSFNNGGTSNAEARIQVDFGNLDFMTAYNAASTEQFTISATIQNTSAGFEIFFLSSGYTAAPPATPSVPEPAAGGLLFLLLSLRRRR